MLVFSKKTWNALSKDDQALLLKLSKETQAEERVLWNKVEAEAFAKMKAAAFTELANGRTSHNRLVGQSAPIHRGNASRLHLGEGLGLDLVPQHAFLGLVSFDSFRRSAWSSFDRAFQVFFEKTSISGTMRCSVRV